MKKVMNLFAYIAIMFVAIAVTIGTFWKDVAVLRSIAEVIAYIITGVSAFYYAKSKQSPVYMILFIVAAILIAVVLIVGIAR